MKGKQRLKSLSQEKQIQLFSFLRGLEAKAHKFLTAMSPAIAMVDKNKQDGYGFGAEYGNFASNTCSKAKCSGKLFILFIIFAFINTCSCRGWDQAKVLGTFQPKPRRRQCKISILLHHLHVKGQGE